MTFIFKRCPECDKRFYYNPHLAPQVRIVQSTVICLECLQSLNELLKSQGLPTIPIPPGAYDTLKE